MKPQGWDRATCRSVFWDRLQRGPHWAGASRGDLERTTHKSHLMPGLCLGSAVLSSVVRNFLAPSRPQCQAIPTPWPHSWQSRGTPSPAAGGRALCWKGEGHGRFLHHRQLSAPCLSIPTPPVLPDTITAERRTGRGTDIPDWEPWWWWLLMARPGRADSAAGLLLIPLPTSPITSPQLRLHPLPPLLEMLPFVLSLNWHFSLNHDHPNERLLIRCSFT